jgi:glycerol-3-phosphate acyltransferase PlsY
MIEFAAVVVGSYLIGSIPSGLIAGRLRGIDVREYGSGNIGGTNVVRTLGVTVGATVLVADVLKGVIAVFLARYFIGSYVGEMAAGLAAVAGHDWSVFIRFQGGRGVATAAGGLFVMAPLVAVSAIAVFALVTALSRYVSLGSMLGGVSAAAIMAVFAAAGRGPWTYVIYAGIAAAVIVLQHRANIARLLAGTESKVGQKGERRQPR